MADVLYNGLTPGDNVLVDFNGSTRQMKLLGLHRDSNGNTIAKVSPLNEHGWDTLNANNYNVRRANLDDEINA